MSMSSAVIGAVVGIAGFVAGTVVFDKVVERQPLPVQFTTRQGGDLGNACRMAHGAPDYLPNGSVLCIPGGGAPTDLDEFLEKRRQDALRNQGL